MATLFHCAQTNVQLQISSVKPYCELAAKQPFFETSQSCVSSTATLSHRFKSSPAIPGNLAVFCAAGYLMNAGHFCESHVSSGDLNRPRESRGSQPSACFCGTFCTPQKVPIRFPYGNARGFPNLDSARPNNNFPLTKLNPLPLCGLSSALGDLFLLLPQQIFALRAIIGGLAAFVTFLWKVCPCRDGTLRVLLSAFLSKEKQTGGKAATHQTATSGSQGSARLTAFA